MTLVSDIISDAYREGNITSIGYDPSTAEIAEGLKRLQVIARTVLGHEAGEQLSALAVGNNNYADAFIADPPNPLPSNVRLICNLEAATTVYLNPNPQDGARLAVVDASANFATHNLTLNGNGRKVDGATTAVLSSNSSSKQYFFRADLADWVEITDFASSDEFPFPEEFDDYFVGKLALRLFPRHSHKISEETVLAMQEAESRFRARYTQIVPTPADAGVLNLTRSRASGNIITGF